jgi:hypothetical protein
MDVQNYTNPASIMYPNSLSSSNNDTDNNNDHDDGQPSIPLRLQVAFTLVVFTLCGLSVLCLVLRCLEKRRARQVEEQRREAEEA